MVMFKLFGGRLMKTSADLVKEYVIDYYNHFQHFPIEVEVNDTVFDYGTYWLILDLFFPNYNFVEAD